MTASGSQRRSPTGNVAGLSVWIDPADPVVILFNAATDALGSSILGFPLPAGPQFVGLTAYAQFAWVDPCAGGVIPGSCAMVMTTQ